MFKLAFTSLLIFALALSRVDAHGYVTAITVGGTNYPGPPLSLYTPATPKPSVIRQVLDGTPVKGADNPDIFCGLSSQPAASVVNVIPGDTIKVHWMGLDDVSAWPHDIGPLMAYLAPCGDLNCTMVTTSDAKFFLIARAGQTQPLGSGWVQSILMAKTPATVVLPANLAPGGYILRSEIIALHLGTDMGGAEFYPSCFQFQVGGTQTGKPNDNELVTFPGAYKDDDPGIYTPKIYDDGFVYQFPGPPIASFISNVSSTNSGSSPVSSLPQNTIGSPQCVLTKRSVDAAAAAAKKKRSTWRRTLRRWIMHS